VIARPVTTTIAAAPTAAERTVTKIFKEPVCIVVVSTDMLDGQRAAAD
jgi:hypothetical protein